MTETALSGRLVGIASGKGGVGKTWIAITLAHACARAGLRVLLFDGDLGLANVDIQLGLVPEREIGTTLKLGQTVMAAAAPYEPGGFDIVAGRSGASSLTNLPIEHLDGIARSLREATRSYDLVLVDLGAGIDRAVRRMAAEADLLLVVATDEPTSLTDAYAVLKLHAIDCRATGRQGERLVVINQAAARQAGERSYATLARASAAFLGSTPGLAAIIRRDDHVREAIRRQTLLLTRSPTCPAAIDMEALARTLLAGKVLASAPPPLAPISVPA